jgi:PleD family two-component response regulator
VLPDTALPEAEQVLHRIQKALAQAVGAGGVPTFTASFGLAGPCAGENFNARLELADEALLLAKRNGRNRIEICSADCRVADSQSDLCLNVELPPPAEPATVTPTT